MNTTTKPGVLAVMRSDRNCATADAARIGTFTDGGSCFVDYLWDDGEEHTVAYTSTSDALDSLRSMGFGAEAALAAFRGEQA